MLEDILGYWNSSEKITEVYNGEKKSWDHSMAVKEDAGVNRKDI